MKRANTVLPLQLFCAENKKQAEINSPPACVCVDQKSDFTASHIFSAIYGLFMV